MSNPGVVFVVAMARNRVIGLDGAMPWHVRSDLKRFKALTWGKPMIMGRKTWASIGSALPGRESIVVTSHPDFTAPGGHVVHSVEAAVERGRQLAVQLSADEIAVIGGGEIFAQMFATACRLHVTEIDCEPAGDAFFPEIDPALWVEERRERHEPGQGDDYGFSYVDYVPRAPSDVA
jgi:dihydrofolate reductase